MRAFRKDKYLMIKRVFFSFIDLHGAPLRMDLTEFLAEETPILCMENFHITKIVFVVACELNGFTFLFASLSCRR